MLESGGAAFWRALSLVTLLLSACSLDYGTPLSDDLGEGVPDTVVYGFSHTVVEDGSPRFRFEAERGESYQSLKVLKLRSVRFTEYATDGTGEVNADGESDAATFHTDTESAELSGSVRFHSSTDAVTVESGYLSWDAEARRLASRAETVTTLRDDEMLTTPLDTMVTMGGDADQGDSNEKQVDPAGSDPAGADTKDADSTDSDADSTDAGDADQSDS